MAITNIGAGGPPNGGLFKSAGTDQRQVILDFAEEIAGATGSRWSKVTGSTTPSELQPYASTIDVGNTGNNNRGFGEHVTLYLDDDASLSFGTPAARMVRFSMGEGGVIMSAIDQVHSDSPNDQTKWIKAVQNTNDTDNFLFTNDDPNVDDITWGNDSTDSNYDDFDHGNQSLDQDFKFFYYLTDDYIWVNAYALEKNTNHGFRGAGFYHPSPPANGTVSRQDHPFIWQMNMFANFNTDGAQEDLWSPASSLIGRGLDQSGISEAFITADNFDYQDRIILSPTFATKNADTGSAWHFDNFIPEARASGDEIVIPNNANDFPTRTLGGTEWMLAGGQSWGGSQYWLKLTGNV